MKHVFLSKYKGYRVRNVQFDRHRAEVTDEATAQALMRDPHYGEGKDFWLAEKLKPGEQSVTENPPNGKGKSTGGQAAGGETELEPEPFSRGDLKRMRKGELEELAAKRGVTVEEGATKDDLVELLATDA